MRCEGRGEIRPLRPRLRERIFHTARDRPQRGTVRAEANASTSRLDGLQIQRAGLPFPSLPQIIADALTDRGRDILVPLDCALFEHAMSSRASVQFQLCACL